MMILAIEIDGFLFFSTFFNLLVLGLVELALMGCGFIKIYTPNGHAKNGKVKRVKQPNPIHMPYWT